MNQGSVTGDASGSAGPGTGGPQGGSDADLATQLAHWKEMARKNEARAKENADKAKQFDTLQDAQKSELQKANERAERAERAAAEAQTERLRISAGAKYLLPPELLPFLTGKTEDEIEAQAKSLVDVMNTSRNGNENRTPQRQSGQRPIESLRPGSAPSTSSTSPQGPDQIFRGMITRG
jgi:hypothetical protein